MNSNDFREKSRITIELRIKLPTLTQLRKELGEIGANRTIILSAAAS